MKGFFDLFRRSPNTPRRRTEHEQRRRREVRREAHRRSDAARDREYDEAERQRTRDRRKAVWDAILGPDRSPRRPPEDGPILRAIKRQASIVLGFVAVMWAVEIVDLLAFGGTLDALGIRPRSTEGLVGIPLAPFLHGGIVHLAMNTVPFVVLAWLVLLRETWQFFAVAAIVTVLGGVGVWLVAPAASVHIGASGLVFGFFGFLLTVGWFERRLGSILISVLVLSLHGGMVFGVLPGQPGVSWQSHLFGFLAGVAAAWFLARRPERGQA
jgi:membrane associated rhomboid family serine protease